MNAQLLKALIVKFDKNQKTLANAMGISLSCLNAKINETRRAEFKQSEIAFISKRYLLSDEEVKSIFFAT